MSATKLNLPKGWRWEKLKDITRVVAGTTPKSGVDAYWNNGEIVWITPTDLGGNSEKDIITSARLITKIGFESCGLEIVPPGSIVLSSRAPIGYLGIARIPLCTNQGCKSFVPSDQIDSLFLYYALKQSVATLQKLGSGATFAEVSKTQLENFEIPLPPIDEQKRIAARLDEQMRHIEQARQAAEECLQAAWELPSAYLRDIFTGEKSKTWAMEKLGNLTTFITDGPHITPKYKAEGIPFLTIRNIVNRKIDLSNVSYISQEDHALFCKRVKAEKGDILYTKDGTLGIPCLVDTDLDFSFFVSVAIIKLMRDKLEPHFVTYALESPQILSQVQELGMGAGLKHMVIKSIKALEIPVPSLQEQQRIAEEITHRLNDAKQITDVIESQLAEINELPSALLRQAFAGGT